MPTAELPAVLHYVRRVAAAVPFAELPDAELLACFTEHGDETAFAALVRRHGPMVLAVCRRVLHDLHAAEDAFQAVFLVLARRARSLGRPDLLAGWLHETARRTALRARTDATRRLTRERRAAVPDAWEPCDEVAWRDLRAVLDEEVSRLPSRYRVPFVLCYLEGLSNAEAARRLGCPKGTVITHLARARERLRGRLAQRGIALSGAALTAVLSQNAGAAGVPASVVSSTIKAASLFAAGKAATSGVISVKVAALTEGVLQAMLLTKLKTVVVVMSVLAMVALGGGLLRQSMAAGQPSESKKDDRVAPQKEAVKDSNEQIQGKGNRVAPNKEGSSSVRVEAVAGTQMQRYAIAFRENSDSKTLQGVWSAVSLERDGKPSKLKKTLFMVDGNRACWQTEEDSIQGGLYLDATTEPKTYDFATSTRTFEGIYSLEKDTLSICYSLAQEAKRPAAFSTEQGQNQVLIVLKRAHGAEFFPHRLPDGTRAFPILIEKEPALPQVPASVQTVPARVSAAPRSGAVPPPLPSKRCYSYVLSVAEQKDGQRKVIAEPRLVTHEGVPASFHLGGEVPVELDGAAEFVPHGLTVRVLGTPAKDGAVKLEIILEQTRLQTQAKNRLDQESRSARTVRVVQPETNVSLSLSPDGQRASTWEVTARVEEVPDRIVHGAAAPGQAEKAYATAEFYQRTGHADSAQFYYELICRRYPGTTPAKRAFERLRELEKSLKPDVVPTAYVGQIHITGNLKTPDAEILKQIPLLPGQALSAPDLRAAEQNLARLGIFSGKPTVTVLDPDGDGKFKDILIKVEEK